MKKNRIKIAAIAAFMAVALALPVRAGGLESILADPSALSGIAGSLGALGGGADIGSLTSILTEDPAFLQEAMKILPDLLNKAKARFTLEEQEQIATAIEGAMSGAGMMTAMTSLAPIIPQVKAIVDAIKNKDQSVMTPGGAVDQVVEKIKSSGIIKLPAELTDKFYVAVRECTGEAVGAAPIQAGGTAGTATTPGASGSDGGAVSAGAVGGAASTPGGIIPGLDTATLGGGPAAGQATGSQGATGSVSTTGDGGAASATGGTASATGGSVVSATGAQIGTAAGQPGTPVGGVSQSQIAAAAAAAKEVELEEKLKKLRDKIKLGLEKVKVLQKELPKMYPPLRIPGASAAHLNIKNVALLLRARYRASGR